MELAARLVGAIETGDVVIRTEGGRITRIDEYLDPEPVIGAIG